MYRLLIVDDEEIIANGIRTSVDWPKLGIVRVEVAYNSRQAKEVFEKQAIDVMICDIEMPQGSGLELYEWVREKSPRTECIFLTCHADFTYAKKALQLGSFEYLLKPVPSDELYRVMEDVLGKIRQDRESATIVAERFWQDLLQQAIPSREDAIMEAIRSGQIPYNAEMRFLPVLVGIQYWEKEFSARDAKILEYALRNALKELVLQQDDPAQLVRIDSNMLLAILSPDGANEAYHNEIEGRCKTFVEACNRYFYCHPFCLIGQPVEAVRMREMVERLIALKKSQVNTADHVIRIDEVTENDAPFPMPPLALWSELINLGDKTKLLTESRQFLESLQNIQGLSAKGMQQFYLNFLQMVLHTLQQKGLRADEIFSLHLTPERISSATASVKQLRDWVTDVLEKAMASIADIDSNESVVGKIKRYITAHIDQELSRQYIADYIGLNPDYVVRLFKKETGISISDYILQQRVHYAKELLDKTDSPISSVALSVGYTNFSYFSTTFKKEVGMTPHEYRMREK